jgi:FAD/FMN-containing dehydrogenase
VVLESATKISGFDSFQAAFSGRLVIPGDGDYDRQRAIWNGGIDRRPAVIARCSSVTDVVSAVKFARESELVVAVRSGGHSYPGHCVCDGGMVIDLAPMRQITFTEADTNVRVGAGVLLRDVDRATTARDRVIPAGIVSHTGFAGLALGGGFGYLTRSCGMTCDQIMRFQVVTADGSVVHASEKENTELFWALRGGGGNFGVVTEFECRLSPLPQINAGMVVAPASRMVASVERVRDIMNSGMRHVCVGIIFGNHRTLRGVAPDAEGGVFALRVVHQGDESDPVLRELRRHAAPIIDTIERRNYCDVQSELDDDSPRGVSWYMKSGQSETLSRDLIETAEQAQDDYYTVASERVERSIHTIMSIGGAASDVPEMATAYPGRAAQWHLAIEVGFTDEIEEARIVAKTRESWAAIEPHLDMQTSYVNMFFDEETSSLARVYGPQKFQRLREVKAKYDPTNLFSHNSNIPPAGAGPDR